MTTRTVPGDGAVKQTERWATKQRLQAIHIFRERLLCSSKQGSTGCCFSRADVGQQGPVDMLGAAYCIEPRPRHEGGKWASCK